MFLSIQIVFGNEYIHSELILDIPQPYYLEEAADQLNTHKSLISQDSTYPMLQRKNSEGIQAVVFICLQI